MLVSHTSSEEENIPSMNQKFAQNIRNNNDGP